jgi:hypothetical protein
MHAPRRDRSVRIALIALTVLFGQNAEASASPMRLNSAGGKTRIDGGYFVEFRARGGLTAFGHAYVVYGRLNAQGKIVAQQVVGFSDGDRRATHVFALRASLAPLEQDLKNPSTVVYRRRLSASQFLQLNEKILQVRRARPPYHMFFFNCTDFAGELAEAVGLRRPPSFLFPAAYVSWLRALNGP